MPGPVGFQLERAQTRYCVGLIHNTMDNKATLRANPEPSEVSNIGVGSFLSLHALLLGSSQIIAGILPSPPPPPAPLRMNVLLNLVQSEPARLGRAGSKAKEKTGSVRVGCY